MSGKKLCDPVVNYERNIREFNVSCSWTIRGILWQSCPGAHWHASSRIVTTSSRRAHEQFAHSSRPGHYILSWPTFWTFQNFRPNMSRSHDRLTHFSRPFTTSLRTGATPVVPMRATESGKCQTSINIELHKCTICRSIHFETQSLARSRFMRLVRVARSHLSIY